jgi:hypothetical protein
MYQAKMKHQTALYTKTDEIGFWKRNVNINPKGTPNKNKKHTKWLAKKKLLGMPFWHTQPEKLMGLEFGREL